MSDKPWQVHKFGGSSLADDACFRRVAGIVLGEPAARQAVVVSAMGGMTDALLTILDGAERADGDIDAGLDSLTLRYTGTVQSLLREGPARADVIHHFERDIQDARDVLQAVALVRSAAARSRDLVAGFGELWSSRLLAAFLEQEAAARGVDCPVHWLDARELIIVEHGELGPAVLWPQSRDNAARCFPAEREGITVVTGFIASDADGLHTTLGRNGSDYSASIIGALLGATSIDIWTDVDGVMSADPNRVPDAAVISELSYNEAMELAYFGARVIHPQTMSPAVEQQIPIRIRNSFHPQAPGSRICKDGDGGELIKGITSIDRVTLVNLEGTGMIGVPGTADRLFGALREASISVILISQASSEHSICFAVPSRNAGIVEAAVRRAFATELELGQIQRVEVQHNCSVIAVVGDGMAGIPGIAARFLGTLGSAGINVRAIAQGSSERNISVVIDGEDETRALRTAHSGFYLSAKTLSVGVVGPGNVGGVLLDQIAEQAGRLLEDFNVDFRVRGIASSGRMLLAEQRIDLENWRKSFESASEPLDMQRFVDHVNADHLPHAVLIDCTASDTVAGYYAEWFAEGIHVVTANKKAQSGPLAYVRELRELRRRHHAHFLYETTVGAGLPITEPSLGLLIANGFNVMLAGLYWISVFPGLLLLTLIFAINIVGDRLREVLNPRNAR